MSSSTLWTGYYRLIYLDRPHIHYFGYPVAFSHSRDDFQQKIEEYCRINQCRLISQLAPLPATLWFQRHGYHALIGQRAKTLEEDEFAFILQEDKTHLTERQNYLLHQTITINPLPDIFHQSQSLLHTPYLPDELIGKGFFEQLNAVDNPKEGLTYPSSDFIYAPNALRYYAIVDGVKSLVLPGLCEKDGRTESLYKGELARKMDVNAPFLMHLTVGDRNNNEFVHLLFAQSEKEWFGLWDTNPAIFIRSRLDFEQVHYHLRKFIHLYNEDTEKWYFFRFYEPAVLVAYLQYIANEPERLASFFGVRDGEAVIDSMAARVDNEFHVFSLADLPTDTQPCAMNYDENFQTFSTTYGITLSCRKLINDILPKEFPSLSIQAQDIKKRLTSYVNQGITDDAVLELLIKAECYLHHTEKTIHQLTQDITEEYGELTITELSVLLYNKAKELGELENEHA